jgi:hypothetical protein
MKKTMKLPKTDSIERLAKFWDTHDVTDFEDELAEAGGAVFVRAAGRGRATGGRGALSVPLKPREARAIERMAQAKGVTAQELVRRWVVQKIAPRRNGRTA